MSERPAVLVTGANGFIGTELVSTLVRTGGFEVIGAVRRAPAKPIPAVRYVQVSDLAPDTDWTESLRGVEYVVHLAARVHVMHDTSVDPLREFRNVNVEGTLNLARQAAAAGVRRFVYLSSIKVNGEGTRPGHPFRATDTPAPVDPYGISKLEAEQGLAMIAAGGTLQTVVIRPPLVYGPGVKANFEAMLRWVNRGIPLPLGAVRNRRSLVAVENLVDLIITCLTHPAAANATFLASDGEDLSTSDLLRLLKVALGGGGMLIPVPGSILGTFATLAGKRAIAQRLLGSLQIDLEPTRRALSWNPPQTVSAALSRVARHFLAARGR